MKAATGSPSFLANVWTMVLLTAAQPGPIREGLSLCGSLWIVANVTIRAFHYLAWLPGLLGLWWFRDRLRSQRGAWVLLGLCALFGCALVRMTAVVGYLSERHVQLLILCGSLWAAAAIVHVGDWLAVRSGRWVATVFLVVFIGFGLPVLARPLHSNQAGYRTAGLWLAAHAQAGDEIIDWHNSAAYYAGRLFGEAAERTPGSLAYVVVEEPQRTPLPADVQLRVDEVIHQGNVVFHCPLESSRHRGKKSLFTPAGRRCRPPLLLKPAYAKPLGYPYPLVPRLCLRSRASKACQIDTTLCNSARLVDSTPESVTVLPWIAISKTLQKILCFRRCHFWPHVREPQWRSLPAVLAQELPLG